MAVGDENPFEPRLEGVPLSLTLDGRSLAGLDGEPLREATFLLMLAEAPVIDAVLLDAPDAFGKRLHRAYLDDPDADRDHRVVRAEGFPRVSIGGVRPWSSRERRADALGLQADARDWFLYYEAATWFSRTSKRLLYVSEDQRLLHELDDPGTQGRWNRRGIVSVRRALGLIGWLMRTRDEIYLEVAPHYTQTTGNYQFYFDLAHWLAPTRVRLHRWLEGQTDLGSEENLRDLEQSMYMRIMDLLKARDRVAFQWLRTRQNNATLDEMLYHLRAAIPTAAALFDSIAVFAQLALGIELQSAQVSLANRDFRRQLRRVGAPLLAEAAGHHGPLWKMLSTLRDPVVHRGGLSGVGYQQVPGPSEVRLTLRSDQEDAVERLAHWAEQPPEHWGLQTREVGEPLVELLAFTHRFTVTVIRAADRIVNCLADDLDAPQLDLTSSAGERERVWKYGLVGGLPDELHYAA